MSNNVSVEKQKSFPGPLGTLLCIWFLTGMLLSMGLSGIYTLLSLPLPPLFFFLSSMIYLTGGLLGGMWSRESLHRRRRSCTDKIVTLFVLLISIGFLFLGFLFVVIGFQHF